LVASRRGLAALPSWGLQNYIEHEYVIAKPIGKKGLWSELYATGTSDIMNRAYAIDLIRIIRESCMQHLPHIKLL
ncbi:MAG TPA: LysR family transcriptional regulator, partial [Methylophilaceae bacterium]